MPATKARTASKKKSAPAARFRVIRSAYPDAMQDNDDDGSSSSSSSGDEDDEGPGSPEHKQQSDDGEGDDQNSPPADDGELDNEPGREHRTHANQEFVKHFNSLSLHGKLSLNMVIEKENREREAKTMRFVRGEADAPGSPAASLMTIDNGELEEISDRATFELFKDVMPPTVGVSVLSRIRKAEQAGHAGTGSSLGKRKGSVDGAADPDRKKRRRVMDGGLAVDRLVGVQRPIEFSDYVYDTEDYVAVPLTLFSNAALRHILDRAATLTTQKANARPGETKGRYILDLEKLTARFGDKLSFDNYGSWLEAATNYLRFQVTRDKDGRKGKFAEFYKLHFGFFAGQDDKLTEFRAWLPLEHRLRQEYRAQLTKYDPYYYAQQYGHCKSDYRMTKHLDERIASMVGTPSVPLAFPSGSQSFRAHVSRPRDDRQSASANGRDRAAREPSCLFCAGPHSVKEHYGSGASSAPKKFANSQDAIWARITGDTMVSPNGKPICIAFNINADRRGWCNHATDGRLHVCSWCGSKSHHALSWTCRSRST